MVPSAQEAAPNTASASAPAVVSAGCATATRDVVGAAAWLAASVVDGGEVSVLEVAEPADATAEQTFLTAVCGNPCGIKAVLG